MQAFLIGIKAGDFTEFYQRRLSVGIASLVAYTLHFICTLLVNLFEKVILARSN